jgi:hypothetical protein
VRAIVESADAIHAVVALFDGSPDGSLVLQPARARPRRMQARVSRARFDASDDSLDDAIGVLARRRADLPAGSFVFVLSDFLGPLRPASRSRLRRLRADVVPVIVQDPTWERSFPEVSGVQLPVQDVATGASRPVRLSRRETAALRVEHEERYAQLVQRFRKAGMDPVTLDDARPEPIHRAFLAWAGRRRRMIRQAS